MSIFSAIGHAFSSVAHDIEHGVEGAAKGFLSGGPLGAIEGGVSGALGEFEKQGGLAGLVGGLSPFSQNQGFANPQSSYGPGPQPGSGMPGSTGVMSLLERAEADIEQIESLLNGGGAGAGTTAIGDNMPPFQPLNGGGAGPGSMPMGSCQPPLPQLNLPTSGSALAGGAPTPFAPTQTNQKAQLIADAQFIAQNSANPAEASQVAIAQNDLQYREANIISNASTISHSNVPASVLQGAMNQIVSDASRGNEANLVGDLNQLSSDIRSGQSPVGRLIYSA
jgi:hypothetical protein